MKYLDDLYSFTKILACFSILLFLTGFYFLSDQYIKNKEYALGYGVGGPDHLDKPVKHIEEEQLSSASVHVLKGKELFEANCTACHAVHKVKVGPALKDISKRRDVKWIRSFVKNPMKKIKVEKDPYAVALYNQYSQTEMTAFPSLSDKDIDAIIEYINH